MTFSTHFKQQWEAHVNMMSLWFPKKKPSNFLVSW